MASTLRYLAIVANNAVNKTIFLIYPATPKLGKVAFQGFRLACTFVWMTHNFLEKEVYSFECFLVP